MATTFPQNIQDDTLDSQFHVLTFPKLVRSVGQFKVHILQLAHEKTREMVKSQVATKKEAQLNFKMGGSSFEGTITSKSKVAPPPFLYLLLAASHPSHCLPCWCLLLLHLLLLPFLLVAPPPCIAGGSSSAPLPLSVVALAMVENRCRFNTSVSFRTTSRQRMWSKKEVLCQVDKRVTETKQWAKHKNLMVMNALRAPTRQHPLEHKPAQWQCSHSNSAHHHHWY